ncbi:unnamed protein product [Pseudo-nitzschia multistriata]|uniref:DUF6824 domain-containing protein n=1 Tax=Pseudo-nitzschia multistriata TaxID=183589 RepID=A0A448ZPL8_9STRA|nr:unnamed protein product [Pseudo-nitzschia multistriata]
MMPMYSTQQSHHYSNNNYDNYSHQHHAQQHGANDDYTDRPKEDPKKVDVLLAEELLKLSCKERNDIQEEVHGVDCLAREETPELLEASLEQMARALEDNRITPFHTKEALRRARVLFPNSYVHTRDFRLRFLRNTLFDPIWAAKKAADYLRIAGDIFGEKALERPILFSDFTAKEKQYIRKGHCQFLPFRDRSGRRILAVVNPTLYTGDSERPLQQMSREERDDSMFFMQAKLLMYMVWTAGYDIETQRRGIVYLCWLDPTHQPKQNFNLSVGIPRLNMTSVFTVRASAVHTCSPDRPFYRFFRNLLIIGSTQANRPKVRFHLGTSIEVRYKLRAFGIPTEHIPVSVTGTIKTGYVKQWMHAREVIEQNYFMNNSNVTIVECPRLDDVLFRHGISFNSNPGNAAVRRLIINTYKEQEIVKIKRRKMVLAIIEDVRKNGGRFLVWNDEGWWNELLDFDDMIMAKVEYIIKDVRRENRISIRQQQQQLKVSSSTSIFCSASTNVQIPSSDEEDGTSDRNCNCSGLMLPAMRRR